MKRNNKLGGYLAVFGALLGIIGTWLIFMNWFDAAVHAEAAEPGCEILLGILMPALSDIGITAGVLYAVCAYGFFTNRNWAFPLVVVTNTLALLASWFINVPMMAAGLPPIYFIIFWPNLVLYFLFLVPVGKVKWGPTLLALLTGMAYIFSFMNGVASWSRIITTDNILFVLVQRLHRFAMMAFAVITVGILLKPKEWMRVAGISAALLELVVGIPLALATTVSLERFSLFSFAPIASAIILVLFLWPGKFQQITGAVE